MPASAPRSRGVELAVGIGVAVALAVLLYAMLLSEGIGVRDELMLAAPEAARPGETIALRAYLYHDPEAAAGPTPQGGDVDVELRDGAHALAHTVLASGALDSMEGALEVPDDAHGHLFLVARARHGGGLVATVARPLEVATDASPAADADRVASPLSHFTLGPLTPDAVPPPLSVATEPGTVVAAPVPPPHVDTLDAWVVGGICVPDARCVVAVDVGALGIDAQLTNCVGAEALPVPESSTPSRYFALPLVVHGPEGTCDLAAVSAADGSRGAMLAHRSIRFPVALATPYLGLERASVDEGPVRWSAIAPPGREGIVLDVFRDGRWMRTLTLPAGNDPDGATDYHDLPGEPLPSGVYLFEARSDALPSTTYLAPRLVVVGGDAALSAAEGAPARPGARDAELTFFLASHEQHGLVLPGTVSGLADDRARLDARKRSARTMAFAGMAVGILLLVVAVLRRGLGADAEARALLAAAGVPGADDAAARRKGRLTVALMVLGLGLALVTGAALIAAREITIDPSTVSG